MPQDQPTTSEGAVMAYRVQYDIYTDRPASIFVAPHAISHIWDGKVSFYRHPGDSMSETEPVNYTDPQASGRGHHWFTKQSDAYAFALAQEQAHTRYLIDRAAISVKQAEAFARYALESNSKEGK